MKTARVFDKQIKHSVLYCLNEGKKKPARNSKDKKMSVIQLNEVLGYVFSDVFALCKNVD